MATDAPPSLTLDIQKALQQAVGDANNIARSIKKKSKRVRLDDETEITDVAASSHKKKKKTKHVEQEQNANVVLDEIAPEPTVGLTKSTDDNSVDFVTKTKKKKSKGKEREKEKDSIPTGAAPEEPSSSEQSANLDVTTSSEDFISAVVAAASATSNAQMPPGPAPSYDQSIHPYIGYSGEFTPYPYAQHPHHPPFDPSQQGQPMYPDPSINLSDLNFASNEELIRTLQDFDLSKVMNVLKTLGEAAAAASVVYNPGPQFVVPPPRGPPVINQRAAKSDSILGRPPRFVQPSVITNHSHEPNGYVPDNPEHAHMLANVWMNTSKLNDLVKTEGKLLHSVSGASSINLCDITQALCTKRGSFPQLRKHNFAPQSNGTVW